jgi:hypothetical protein
VDAAERGSPDVSRLCSCHRKCRHLASSGSEALLQAERLLALEDVLPILIDAADAFDSDSLTIDADCAIHGTRPTSNSECSCRGTRYTASEFIQTLQIDVRAAAHRREPLSQDRRARWARKERAKQIGLTSTAAA